MRHLGFLVDGFRRRGTFTAIVWQGQSYDYGWLADRIDYWLNRFEHLKLHPGTVVVVESDFTPETIALFLALLDHEVIVAPLSGNAPDHTRDQVRNISRAEVLFRFSENDQPEIQTTELTADHDYFQELRRRGKPGLILFSSGSTGEPKGAVHDFSLLLEKFRNPRPAIHMPGFLLFDHIGGVNTLLHTLANGGTFYTLEDRSPDRVCALLERYRIPVLPVSPTFLNLMLISEAHKRYDLSSLQTITYGAEPMPPSTLAHLHRLFPGVKLQQTYGLIELGIFRSRSKSSDSLWIKLDTDYRIVDGILQIKTRSTMLGYLNAPSPFTEDGWYNTGDAVKEDGEGYLRIYGRESELINVGGEKVFPQEVENVIQEVENVREVVVFKEANPITGNIVCARISLVEPGENPREVRKRIKKYCAGKLEPFKVPVKIRVVEEDLATRRGKKKRAGLS